MHRKKCNFCLILWVIGLAATLSLTSFQNAFGVDSSFTGTTPTGTVKAALLGVAFLDKNHNGKVDKDEYAVWGVNVALYNSSDLSTPIATTKVNCNGEYFFDNLTPGTYSVRNLTDGNWVPDIGSITNSKNSPVNTGLGTANAGAVSIDDIVLNAGDIAELYNFGADNYPMQLLSKRLLLASSCNEVLHAVPEPSTIVLLIVAAITFGAGAAGRRFFT